MKTFVAKGDYTLTAPNEWYIQRGFTDANEVFSSLSKRYWSVLFANQGTFIGSDNPLFGVAGCSVVIAPYLNSREQIVGAIGVIGPTRINYARIIPMVDYTAKVIGRLIG